MPTTDTPPQNATHELRELEVFEVSLVDRPANKRKFLAIKEANSMPAGQELTDDGAGGLTPVTKGFGASSKKKLKSAMSSAVTRLSALIESIADADDESSFVKQLSAVASGLGKFGGSSETSEKSDDVPADVDPISAAALQEIVDANETRRSAEAAALQKAQVDKQTARHDALAANLSQLNQVAHTLCGIVKSTHTGGSRPASQAAAAGETGVTDPADTRVWKLDMNSDDIPKEDRF